MAMKMTGIATDSVSIEIHYPGQYSGATYRILQLSLAQTWCVQGRTKSKEQFVLVVVQVKIRESLVRYQARVPVTNNISAIEIELPCSRFSFSILNAKLIDRNLPLDAPVSSRTPPAGNSRPKPSLHYADSLSSLRYLGVTLIRALVCTKACIDNDNKKTLRFWYTIQAIS